MKKILFLFLFFFLTVQITFSTNYKVLFIGNSYTSVNNLPNLVSNVANSTGDSIFYLVNDPGGAFFSNHCTNQSMTYIQQGGWDYVVLQEQSQLPSFPISQVQAEVFPYAAQLNDSIEKYSPCGETVFYMTWGRETGDPQWAPISTYEGMDDSLYVRYMMMAEDNDAIVSPVGRVWRYIRTNYPDMQLYSSDGSHPSFLGSYAAACSFYTVFFRKDPTLITYDGSLSASEAALVRQVVKTVVYDQLTTWFVGEYDPFASFDYSIEEGSLYTTNTSMNAQYYYWDFGDGTFSNEKNPNHIYDENGIFDITLIVSDSCDRHDTLIQSIEIELSIPEHQNISNIDIYPNPFQEELTIYAAVHFYQSSVICKIYNTQGALVYESKIEEGENVLNLSMLSKGVFLITFNDVQSKVLKRSKIVKM